MRSRSQGCSCAKWDKIISLDIMRLVQISQTIMVEKEMEASEQGVVALVLSSREKKGGPSSSRLKPCPKPRSVAVLTRRSYAAQGCVFCAHVSQLYTFCLFPTYSPECFSWLVLQLCQMSRVPHLPRQFPCQLFCSFLQRRFSNPVVSCFPVVAGWESKSYQAVRGEQSHCWIFPVESTF